MSLESLQNGVLPYILYRKLNLTPSPWQALVRHANMLEVGQRATYQRTFTSEDVKAFADLSGDKGIHHIEPDSKGRIMVQGLLTATIPTKLGGDLNYIARRVVIDFVRPVFAGDTITCESTVERVESVEGRLNVSLSFLCRNQHGKEVLQGSTEGVIRV